MENWWTDGEEPSGRLVISDKHTDPLLLICALDMCSWYALLICTIKSYEFNVAKNKSYVIMCLYGVRVKRYFAPNLISMSCSAAKQLSQFSNIRDVNHCFLMFDGSKVQKSYRAGTNVFFDLLTLISLY